MQNKVHKITLTFMAFVLILTGCAVKKMVKQAEQYEGAGMFKEASAMYFQAVQKKPEKAEYKIALKRTGQIYYEELAAEAKSSFNRGDYKETVYYYMEAAEMMNKYNRAGVSIKSDPAMERYFADAKDHYLDEQYNRGLKHITDQEFEEAKRIFSEISDIDADFKDTRSYLNQATYEPVYREGTTHYNEGRYMDAYRKWESIFVREKNYKDTKDRMDQALSERYKEGTLFLMDENFADASGALGDVYRANPNFKDVKMLYTEARNEPVYRQAKHNLNQEKCRTAYFGFEKIIADAGTYKDTRTLKDQALKCAEYPVAVYSSPLKHYAADAMQFENAAIASLVNTNNVFLKVFDLTAINSSLENRLLNSAGVIDKSLLQKLNRENNIKAVLILGYDNFEKNKGNLKKEVITGYERTVTKSTEGETKIYDRQVKYNEYSQENKISLMVQYKLVSAITGEILLSETYSDSETDNIRYATYQGDKSRLYPAKSIRGSWNIDESGYRKLQSLLEEKTQIKSIEYLQKLLFSHLSENIANDINNFNPEQ